ncbi:carboxy-S-adenosyl-L-methionine synthase CmoA [Helicobacter sp. 11S03491-1]|uniref:carboxy-S-adenosyl-L-methionine synthase CmoA n=1 Tax=Helicobacter sp. 11S03491-1 TaxID=1476196 RepID=UPI000BA5F169|nr:carboxy-S-adenosyl-L-methionine synthase CmoA [Helicobacter sp. 11S03491-1]PAF42615.1 carboxy-S-adenosyl-L-methionine synthase CmoA [Helicobacter sp. 11S03491-1]
MKDKIFTKIYSKQFEFDEGVASVFDDMALRSIPYYCESLKLSVDFALNALGEQGIVYDLGCSTGSFLIELAQKIKGMQIDLIGVDSSKAMIERAKLKAKTYGKEIEFICKDFLDIDIHNACVVVTNYTMQFVRPMQRHILAHKIFEGLCEGGILIMSEKMTSQDKVLDRQMIDRYYLYKKEQGYTQNEINTKREALENVLIPYTLEENFKMLKEVGFQSVEVLFKWVNFATLIARKI